MIKNFVKIFSLLLVISSCGFQVIYRESKSDISYEQELASIKIQKNEGRLTQELRNSLYDLFNPNSIKAEPKYFVVLTLAESIGSTFLTSTGASGRNKITLNLTYKFFDLKTGELLAKGFTSASDNYDVQLNRYGTHTAEEYTKSNLVKVLAQNIRNLLVNDIIELKKEKDEKDNPNPESRSKTKSSKASAR